MAKPILVAGAGRVGSLTAYLLADSGDYQVYLADINLKDFELTCKSRHLELSRLDVTDESSMAEFLQRHAIEAIVSCLPYFCNIRLATLAKQFGTHYFDLTEDVKTRKAIQQLAENSNKAFVPGCGLAPGFIDIVGQHLMQNFEELETVKLRVGCLPLVTDNALQYALTWSTEGLINEYGNLCPAILNGEAVELQPLEDCEALELDGIVYEAFNTSGGIGTLAETYLGKVRNLNYRTIRYPGHCAKMRFLMKDLKLNEDRNTLKNILENALPKISQDVVIVYASVSGKKQKHFIEETYVNKLYPQKLFDKYWSSIQITTASSVCSVIDLVFANPKVYTGFVRQEQFKWKEFLDNRFGRIFKKI